VSYEDGRAALNLDMPPRVPRTEYSVQRHWELLRAVTGIDVSAGSDDVTKAGAQKAFFRAWDFGLHWSTCIGGGELKAARSSMGSADYGADHPARADTHQLFDEPEEALAFDPWETYGSIDEPAVTRRFEGHYRRQCALDPDSVNMTGIYITLVSGLIEIFGWEMLLLAAGTDRRRFGELTDRYASWIAQYYDALAAADVPVVMCHDDIVWTEGPFLPPAWYREHVFPHYRRFFGPLRDSGKKVLYTSDGNYTMFLDDVAAAGADGFFLEPMTDLAYAAETFGQSHVIVGNADTRVLLSGTEEQIRDEVARCMEVGKGCPGFFLAVGNHIPPNTPVESAVYYNQVYEELAVR
jgi:hypothetical protein